MAAAASACWSALSCQTSRLQSRKTPLREGDAEPEEASQQVALVAGGWLGSNGTLPVGLVVEDSAEVADDVDDAKDQAALQAMCQ